VYKILVRNRDGNKPCVRYSVRWKDSIRNVLRKRDAKRVHWIHLAQNREKWRAVVNTAMNIKVS
jgi:hypothetical protein